MDHLSYKKPGSQQKLGVLNKKTVKKAREEGHEKKEGGKML